MAGEKETILSGLRDYHVQQFPLEFKNKDLNKIKSEFEPLADSVIFEILSFVSGKAAFTDSTNKLVTLSEKASKIPAAKLMGKEKEEQEMLVSKIDQLLKIVTYTKKCSFRLRKVREPHKAV